MDCWRENNNFRCIVFSSVFSYISLKSRRGGAARGQKTKHENRFQLLFAVFCADNATTQSKNAHKVAFAFSVRCTAAALAPLHLILAQSRKREVLRKLCGFRVQCTLMLSDSLTVLRLQFFNLKSWLPFVLSREIKGDRVELSALTQEWDDEAWKRVLGGKTMEIECSMRECASMVYF